MAAYLFLVLVSRVRRIFPMQTRASPTLVCLLAHTDDSMEEMSGEWSFGDKAELYSINAVHVLPKTPR